MVYLSFKILKGMPKRQFRFGSILKSLTKSHKTLTKHFNESWFEGALDSEAAWNSITFYAFAQILKPFWKSKIDKKNE